MVNTSGRTLVEVKVNLSFFIVARIRPVVGSSPSFDEVILAKFYYTQLPIPRTVSERVE